MDTPRIDYRELFAATPNPYLVLDRELVAVAVNEAYLEATGRSREELIGNYLFAVHPDNPADPEADGVRNLKLSLERVLRTGEPDTMAVQKYDVPVSGRPGVFRAKWWSPVNTPVLAPDGRVEWIVHRVEDMTGFMQDRSQAPGREQEALEAEMYARAQELQHVNEGLRDAHARERETALALQKAMLHAPDLAVHGGIAVRYIPAVRSLNVCGDWYDVANLSDDEYAVAVGDVVGHGLEAAAAMGMLRSALSAAVRATERPGTAMDVLNRYAGVVEGALATTAVKTVINTRHHLLTYTSAGHPPPLLAHADGTVTVLDQATDPPLGVVTDPGPRAQATVPYSPGDTLVLYTDGLIERRGEDIDAGLHRLTDAVARHVRWGPEELADLLLVRLGVPHGGDDDIALVTARL